MAIASRVKYWYTRTGIFAREIVLKRAVIMATIIGVLGTLTQANIIPLGLSTSITGYVVVGFAVVAGLVEAVWTRTSVTPANPELSPVSNNGVPLVEVAPEVLASPYVPRHAVPDIAPHEDGRGI